MIEGDPTVTLLNTQPLLSRLGVKGIAKLRLVPQVVPVAIVDGSIQAVGLQTLDVPFTAGETTAPGAGTRLATGPPLAAGQYNLTFMIFANESASYRLRRRNAADSADIWAQRVSAGSAIASNPNIGLPIYAMRVVAAANEFFVLENVGAGGAGIVYQASLWFQGPF